MPQHYKYKNKNQRYKNVNQEVDDLNYFNAKEYCKIIAKKYGLKNEGVEDAFKQYFLCMKEFGLTKIINPKVLRRKIDEFVIDYQKTLGSKLISASADIFTSTIRLKNSFRKSKIGVLFHEANHLFSTGKEVKYSTYDDMIKDFNEFATNNVFLKFNKDISFKSSGFAGIFADENRQVEYANEFDEGVCEFLAKIQESFYKKKTVAYDGYVVNPAVARLLYSICGNALFDDYFNGGDYSIIAREVEKFGICKDDIVNLSNFVTMNLGEADEEKAFISTNAIGNAYLLLINMFTSKMATQALENLKSFKSFNELKNALATAYCEFSKGFSFGVNGNSLMNYNREDVFTTLTNSYFQILEAVGDLISENPDIVEYSVEEGEFEEDEYDKYYKFFEAVNDSEHNLLYYKDIKNINLIECVDSTLMLHRETKADYIRTKGKLGRPRDMKNAEEYERYYNEFAQYVESEQ